MTLRKTVCKSSLVHVLCPFIKGSLALVIVITGHAHAQTVQSSEQIDFALTGDSLVNQRLLIYKDPATLRLYKDISGADAAFTNFESGVPDGHSSASAQGGGLYQSSPAWVLDELSGIGFNLFSTANNHAYDFGAEGLLSTIKSMDDRGLVHAGSGENLALARAPGYLDTEKGRVALIAIASSMTQGSQAGEQRPDMIGRPGINPLRFKTVYTVDAKTFDTLQSVAKLIMHDSANEIVDDRETYKNKGNQPQLIIQGLTFVRDNATAINSFPDNNDLENLVASVSDARREAEWVVVSSHTHESGAEGDDTPPEFLITAAHAAIDAGADIFVAHGPHILRGIEIYHGRPIFYSLGDFVLQNETMQFQPAEIYDALGLPSTANVADIYDTRSLLDTRGFPARRAVWESVVAKVSFHKDHSLAEVKLIPISLGFKEPRYERGRPKLASPEQSKSIIEGVSKLSKAFGTRIVFGDGRGIVVLDPAKPK